MKNGVFCSENPDADGDGEVLSDDSAEGGTRRFVLPGYYRIWFHILSFYCKTVIKALRRAFFERKMRKFGNCFQEHSKQN